MPAWKSMPLSAWSRRQFSIAAVERSRAVTELPSRPKKEASRPLPQPISRMLSAASAALPHAARRATDRRRPPPWHRRPASAPRGPCRSRRRSCAGRSRRSGTPRRRAGGVVVPEHEAGGDRLVVHFGEILVRPVDELRRLLVALAPLSLGHLQVDPEPAGDVGVEPGERLLVHGYGGDHHRVPLGGEVAAQAEVDPARGRSAGSRS